MNKLSEDQIEINFWEEKPSWCQPWSIILTGLLVIILSIFWPSRTWLTLLLTIIIGLWWTLFLWLAPNLYRKEFENIDVNK